MKVFLTVRGHYKKKHLFVTKFYIGYVQEACNLSSEITCFFFSGTYVIFYSKRKKNNRLVSPWKDHRTH